MQIIDALKHAKSQLHASESAQLDSELLICEVLNCERSHLYAYPEKELSEKNIESLNRFITLRSQGHPIAHLTQKKEFWSLSFHVNQDTLIPRPETEVLVEAALKRIPEKSQYDILDLGTGSGSIAIAIATERPLTNITATDKSDKALKVALQNAKNHNIKNINFINADWFNNECIHSYDLIISNPPYICENDVHLKQSDVMFEPLSALTSGVEGLDDLRLISNQAMYHLNKHGWLMVEHGYNQAKQVQQLFNENNFNSVMTIKDYSENDRVTIGKKDE